MASLSQNELKDLICSMITVPHTGTPSVTYACICSKTNQVTPWARSIVWLALSITKLSAMYTMTETIIWKFNLRLRALPWQHGACCIIGTKYAPFRRHSWWSRLLVPCDILTISYTGARDLARPTWFPLKNEAQLCIVNYTFRDKFQWNGNGNSNKK